MRIGTLAAALAVGFSAAAGAQTPAGGPFRVNTFTLNEQKFGHPAVGPRGDFLISWSSLEQDGSGFGVYAQLFDALGNPQGGEFRVNTAAAGNQYSTSAVADAGGNYIIAWTNDVGNPDPSRDIFARVFAPWGAALTPEFRVNAFVAGRQSSPAIAALPGGGFVIVWESLNQDGSSFAVVGRRFDSRGGPLGGDFLVNTFTPGVQAAPRISSDAAGNFVVVWHSENQDGSARGVFGRRFNASASPLGGEFLVNTYTSNFQQYPVVSAIADGRFVVAWESGNTIGGPTQDGNNYGIFGRTFDAAGNPTSGEYQINVYTTDHQRTPTVVNYGNGSFMAAWYSQDQLLPFPNQDVFGRQYLAGVPGPEFLVNSYTGGNQFLGAVDSDEVGNVVAVWDSIGQDGSLNGVYARRFGGLVPFALGVDYAGPVSNANRVFEAGETVIVQPWWRNVNGATLAFDGAASAFTGPAGPAYTIIDGAADYGSVGNNTVGFCLDGPSCYALRITGARPTPHWDAQFREDIQPFSLGQSKVWTLHVGDTFTDVPRTNSFYRFVETVLHNNVMPGCTPSQFCPFGAVFRDQMAMFVLKSREPHFVPPACVPGQEMFADLPASNPYCRYVQELARRGVVAGCGAGNYCPSAGVSREQLAVYLLSTLQGVGYTPPPCGTPVFNDVPASSPFCRWVEDLYRRGVVAGCGGGAYCPAYAVGRDQMSVFLSVTFSLVIYGP